MDFHCSVPRSGWGWWRLHLGTAHFKKGQSRWGQGRGTGECFAAASNRLEISCVWWDSSQSKPGSSCMDQPLILHQDPSSPTLGRILLFRCHISASNLLSNASHSPISDLGYIWGWNHRGLLPSRFSTACPQFRLGLSVLTWWDSGRAEGEVGVAKAERRSGGWCSLRGAGLWVCVAEAVTARPTTGEDCALRREAGVCLHGPGVNNKCCWGWRWLVVWR